MAYKAFSEKDQQPFAVNESSSISISEDSPCASHLHLFTGIRSLGKVSVFKVGVPPSFGDISTKEIKYKWDFDGVVLPGMKETLSGAVYDGSFLSSADQTYSIHGNNTRTSSQDVFRFVQSYLYRPDKLLRQSSQQSSTALMSSSSADYKTDVIREINITKDLFKSSIQPQSLRIQVNDSNTSITGRIDGPSANAGYRSIAADAVFGSQTPNVTGFTSAIEIKNPYGGEMSTSRKSFFGVPLRIESNSSNASNIFKYIPKDRENLQSINTACTLEAIIRPFQSNSTIYFRRLGLTGTVDAFAAGEPLDGNDEYKNNFMKLELTTSPDGILPAFRFYIRSATASTMWSEDYAQLNTQTSGLFVPNDVGIDLFDGQFHHIAVTWSTEDIEGTGDTQRGDLGAGLVLGYIDGYKLGNKEQIFPRLSSSDSSSGPVVQTNMLENRIPLKQTPIYDSSIGWNNNFIHNANNAYIGASNFNRDNGDYKGDIGPLATQFDSKLEGTFDGQIQHLRMWNIRLKDGLTSNVSINGINERVALTSNSDYYYEGVRSLAQSFKDFNSVSLTSVSAANIVSWWYFNNINGTTGSDIAGGLSATEAFMEPDFYGNVSSNTGNMIGNSTVKLFDNRNLTPPGGISNNKLLDLQVSGISRDYLYFDQAPNNQPINNYITQGTILRTGIDETLHKIGLVFYDVGLTTFDGDDPNARLNWTYPASGATGDMGFAVTGHLNTSFNFQRIVFGSQVDRSTLLLNAEAVGNEMNFAGNPSGYSVETEEPVFDDPTTYITSIGLYNHQNDLLAVAKLAKPVKKDDTINLATQIKLDF